MQRKLYFVGSADPQDGWASASPALPYLIPSFFSKPDHDELVRRLLRLLDAVQNARPRVRQRRPFVPVTEIP